MAESVDALDLKSNRGSPSVPVQVWPGAILKDLFLATGLFCMAAPELSRLFQSLSINRLLRLALNGTAHTCNGNPAISVGSCFGSRFARASARLGLAWSNSKRSVSHNGSFLLKNSRYSKLLS